MKALIEFLRLQLHSAPAIIGLSGGVDSAVVSYLCTQAVGPQQVFGYYLPSSTNAPDDATHATIVAEQLGLTYQAIPIDPIIAGYEVHLGEVNPLVLGNLKARVRMTVLYAKANQLGGRVVGTGNKTELQLGYFTKYGDGGVDLLPLAGLYKTQVWQLARDLGIPEEIIIKPPSAGLWDGQTDEQELGITYVMADHILQAMEQEQSLTQFDPAFVQIVQQRRQQAQHKLQSPVQP